MQLVQISQPATVTVQQLIERIAARQLAEIEQLRQAALANHAIRKTRNAAAPRTRRYRKPTVRRSAGSFAVAGSSTASL